MSNLGLERFLADHALTLARTKVGDRYVTEHMRANGFNIGGEQSGHIILSDFSTTGDGLLAALQVLAEVKRAAGRPASEVCNLFTPLPQILKNVKFKSGKPLDDNQVLKSIAEAERRLGNSGRLVIRPSGTEPLIRVMGRGRRRDAGPQHCRRTLRRDLQGRRLKAPSTDDVCRILSPASWEMDDPFGILLPPAEKRKACTGPFSRLREKVARSAG